MIIGGSKKEVIANMQSAAERGDLNAKVETGDPVLTPEESDELIKNFLSKRNTFSYKAKCLAARTVAGTISRMLNKNTEIEGKEKLLEINGGFFITCNHFNPLDNTAILYLMQKSSGKRLFTVAQETNFAMTGPVGFLMNHADTIPISRNMHYMQREFLDIISEKIKDGNAVLIYPEQEMWFNYKKPRPVKPGTYHYAAKLNVPVASCLVELITSDTPDNDEFFKIGYKIHVLDVIYPDPKLTSRENSRLMQKKDDSLRREAYKKIYGGDPDSPFSVLDVAGYRAGAL